MYARSLEDLYLFSVKIVVILLTNMLKFYAIYFATLTYVAITAVQGISQNEIQEKAKILNISYNKCASGKLCVHGLCNKKMGSCVCYYGWRGELCDRLARNSNLFRPQKVVARNEPFKIENKIVTPTQRKLMNPDRYVINLLMAFFPKLRGYFKRILDIGAVNKEKTNTFYISPVATSKFAMKVKEQSLAQRRTTTTTESPDPDISNKVIDIIPTSEEIHEEPESIDNGVCSDSYKTRPLQERKCASGLVCEYGTCSSEHKGTYISFDCSCDAGASGMLCEHKCCLDCGSNGRCAIFADGKEYCRCRKGYFGGKCEQSEPEVKFANPHFSPKSQIYDVVYTVASK